MWLLLLALSSTATPRFELSVTACPAFPNVDVTEALRAAVNATNGAKCAADALACEGCWGNQPFTCEQGSWVFHNIGPPP